MQLHAVNKQKPMKKFVSRERETTEEKGQKHHTESRLRCRDYLDAGEMTSADCARNPSFFIFARSTFEKEEAVQPIACFFTPFFAILLRCVTRLMGMQWRGARRCKKA
jgi:hypothetical protein